MDKIDGPYYFFKALQKVRHALPEWFPLVGLEFGYTNIVPVDYVAAAMDHIAHAAGPRRAGVPPHGHPSPSARARSSTRSPRPRTRRTWRMRIDKRLTDALPKGVGSLLLQLPALKGVRRSILADLGIPEEILGHIGFTAQFDTRDSRARAGGHGHRGPAARRPTPSEAGTTGSASSTPTSTRTARSRRAINGRTVGHHRRLERHRPRGGA